MMSGKLAIPHGVWGMLQSASILVRVGKRIMFINKTGNSEEYTITRPREIPHSTGIQRGSDVASRCPTFSDVLAFRAAGQPDREAFVFVSGEHRRSALTYGTLLRNSTAVAAALRRSGSPGERVLLVYPPGLHFISALFGCWAAGMVAIPAYPPRNINDRARQRLVGIMHDAGPSQVLTVAPLMDTLRSIPEVDRIGCLPTDELEDRAIGGMETVRASSGDVALLQYTSGTTASPKGVVVTHANLLHNSAVIYDSFRHSPESHGVIWLPPYHDMGLIGGVLQPLYAGFPVTLMAPAYFLQRPLRWLQAISGQSRVTSGGPNFAYELCVRAISNEDRLGLDLSGWDVAFNGAEPIDPAVLDRFAETFGSCGFRREAFYPCYGLAESTLMVSGGEKGLSPRLAHDSKGARVISCGRARNEGQIVVVDPETRLALRDGGVGEVWIAGPSVAKGYWQQPELTETTFGAFLSNNGEGPFLRSGDLGFLRDGELYVVGRLKDLIIVRGVNHYPTDLERTAGSCHAAVRPGCGAAFSVMEEGEERLVIVQEIERSQRDKDLTGVIAAIRRAISGTHEIQAHAILLLRPGQILKTSSGKVQRGAVREAFVAGTLDPVHQWRFSRELEESRGSPLGDEASIVELQGWIAARLAVAVGTDVEAIDVNEPFARYGLDSVQAVVMAEEIAQRLGREISAALFWDYPTVAELARQLATPEDVSSNH